MDQAGIAWLVVTVSQRDNGLVLGVKGERRRGPLVDDRILLNIPTAAGMATRLFWLGAPQSLIDRLHHLGPAGVTLFLDVQRGLEALPLEDILRGYLNQLGLTSTIRLSRLGRRAWLRRSGFKLPLRIAGLGGWEQEIERITDSKGWASHARDNGGLFTGLPSEGDSALDVLVTGSENLGLAREVMGADAPGAGVRLLVVADDGREGLLPYLAQRFPLRPGQSMLVVPQGPVWVGRPLGDLFDEITHDQTFDELAERFSTAGKSAVLISDPAATQSLRMSDAASALIDEVATIGRSVFTQAPNRLLEQIDDPQLRDAMRKAGAFADVGGIAAAAARGDISFLRESRGFLPLTFAHASLEAARRAAEETRTLFADVSLASSGQSVEAAQSRVVNITLQRTVYRENLDPLVGTWERLERGAPYRLLVDIGERSWASLITGAVGPIDPLLPELDYGGRHLLHVAVYSEDFRVEPPAEPGPVAQATSNSASPSPEPSKPLLRRLELPRIGPSAPVEFVVTPISSEPIGEARIAIYYDRSPADGEQDPDEYRNHLLQSFLLKAEVGDVDALRRADDSGIEVKLDMSQTERFANLDRLKPRFVSLTINGGPGDATHRLMVKRGSLASGASFPDTLMQKTLTDMRVLLADLCWNDDKTGPRFSGQAVAGALTPTFNQALMSLAKAGRQIYEGVILHLLGQEQGMAMIRAVRESADEVIQVMRLDLNYYFPWTLIYDFAKPAVDAPVCDGFLRTQWGRPITCAECLKACKHPDKSEAYCAFGFWGTRHQIEQLIGGSVGADTATSLRPVGDGAVHMAVGIEDGTLGGLEAELRACLPGQPRTWISVAEPNEDLMWRLRDAQTRPAILLLASHCESSDGPFASPRIQLAGSDHWLEPSELIDEVVNHDPWKAPQQPLVVLAACDSAAADLVKLTDFVAAFLRAGASAVVGTEAVIFERLAVKFATSFTPEMLNGRNLGATMLDFRRSLLRQGDPLGFLFTAYGPADLATPPLLTAAAQTTIVEPA